MILAFHGCPGLPDDFSALSEALSREAGAQNLQAIIRAGYPGADSQKLCASDGTYYLGYSFGCADCVESASKDSSAKGVILIAPHLYELKQTSAGMRALLGLPLVSDLLLSLFGPKAMKGFATRTSFPAEPSESYFRSCQRYARPGILRRAMTEAQGRAAGIQNALQILKSRNTPILLISGSKDQVSPETSQILPLRGLFPNLQALTLENAGHALLWTHPQALAQAITHFTQGERS